jgi:hypothetical protein
LTVFDGTHVAADANANATSVNGTIRVDLHAVAALDIIEL